MSVSRETLKVELQKRLSLWLDHWNIYVSEASVERLIQYIFMLSAYEAANVVGTRDPGALLELHIADSLSCLLHPGLSEAYEIVDVGSGAGLPGLALGISLPGAKVTLVESTGKKTAFMRGAAESLGISEANILSARAEEVGWDPDFRERFDVATARALASMPVLVEYCLPLVKVGGLVVAMKGKPSREELDLGSRAAEMLGGRLENVIEVPPLPDTEARDRCLVVIRKEAETSKKYPRRVGLPRQQPLGG